MDFWIGARLNYDRSDIGHPYRWRTPVFHICHTIFYGIGSNRFFISPHSIWRVLHKKDTKLLEYSTLGGNIFEYENRRDFTASAKTKVPYDLPPHWELTRSYSVTESIITSSITWLRFLHKYRKYFIRNLLLVCHRIFFAVVALSSCWKLYNQAS